MSKVAHILRFRDSQPERCPRNSPIPCSRRFLSIFGRLLRLLPAILCLGIIARVDHPFSAPAAEHRANARVIIVHDPEATHTFTPQPETIRAMVERGLSALWQTPNAAAGWQSRLSPDDVVGIRIHSAPGKTGGSRPAVVAALLQSLLDSGHPASQIIVWDRQISSLQAAGHLALRDKFSIQVKGARQAGCDVDAAYESPLIGALVWGDHEFGKKGEGIGRRSFVTKLLTRKITKIINLAPLLNHNRAGVYGNLVGLALASVDNTFRFQSDPDRLAIAVPEIIALPEIGDRIFLNIVDALIAQYQGETQTRLQDSAVLNELRFSADPVALDVLSLDELEKQRARKGIASPPLDRALYKNASLLQLGTSDPDAIPIERISMTPRPNLPPTAGN